MQSLRNTDVIVSGLHLRWDGVRQRPNHVLSRLAGRAPVIVLEEPKACDDGIADDEHVVTDYEVSVVTPRRANASDAIDGRAIDTIRAFVGGRRPLVWMYTPMMAALADAFPQAPVVFDKMDELAAFAHADPRMAERESYLLARADVTFAGGRSLYETVRHRTGSARCYPSGVDAPHFAAAKTIAAHPAVRALTSKPVLGYVGVVDERLDLELIAHVADAQPLSTVLMIGPVVKIPEQSLPRRPNIVYYGNASYDDLPALLAGIDVALMPFALNRHTQNISPTKTLEYLAAGKPVVSTAVADVVRDYGDVVAIATDRDAFVRAIVAARKPDPERDARTRQKVDGQSWDAIVKAMCDDLGARGIVVG